MLFDRAPLVTLTLVCSTVLLCSHASAQAPAVEVALFDTGTSASTPLAGETLSRRAGWTKIREDKTDHEFQGDAVMMNDRLAAVFRRGGPGAEVYSLSETGPVLRAVLAPVPGRMKSRLASVRIVENTPGLVAVEGVFDGGDGRRVVVRYRLEMGQVFLKTEAGQGAEGLWLGAASRFVILPDFFADDMVVDATAIPVSEAELPSEHFLLHMVGRGEAIVMSVSDSAAEDVKIELEGRGQSRRIRGSEIRYGKEGRIWVAVLEGRDVWHNHAVAESDAGKIIDLAWNAPYPAQWRVDWSRADQLTGSWEMIAEKPSGDFVKHGWFGYPNTIGSDRRRWTTVLGRFYYPCWIDQSGRGHLQPFGKRIRFQGPALIYPINRLKETPLTAFTVVDVVRATLGVGPCEYILDVEGQPTAMKGRATCATRDTLNPIYAAGRQKHQRATIEKALVEVLAFVTHIRGRINAYVDFGHELREYLDEQRAAHPELSEFLSEMQSLARAIDERFDARKEKIQTPQYVAGLTDKFRATLLDYEGKDALDKCKAITGAIVTVGGNQDELVGECRMAVKVLRQRAGLAMATDPRTAEVAQEIRSRTQQILRNPASYEAPRH